MQVMTEAKRHGQYRIFEETVSVTYSNSYSKAPNGSAVCHDFYTTVTVRQEWLSDAEGASLDGMVYKIVTVWIGPKQGMKHVQVSKSSTPWI
jgi:hypothetical protein